MPETTVNLYRNKGIENTRPTLDIVKKRAEELHIEQIVAATTTGRTALACAGCMPEMKTIVGVTMHAIDKEKWAYTLDASTPGRMNTMEKPQKKDAENLINLLLTGNSGSKRGRAALALGEIRDARAVEPLIKALEDEDQNVHWQAAWALGEIGDARAVQPLIRVLKGQFPVDQNSVRESALALVKIGSHAVRPLIKVLQKDEDDFRRTSAIMILGKIGDARAVEPLTIALKDRDKNVRDAAEKVLSILESGENI